MQTIAIAGARSLDVENTDVIVAFWEGMKKLQSHLSGTGPYDFILDGRWGIETIVSTYLTGGFDPKINRPVSHLRRDANDTGTLYPTYSRLYNMFYASSAALLLSVDTGDTMPPRTGNGGSTTYLNDVEEEATFSTSREPRSIGQDVFIRTARGAALACSIPTVEVFVGGSRAPVMATPSTPWQPDVYEPTDFLVTPTGGWHSDNLADLNMRKAKALEIKLPPPKPKKKVRKKRITANKHDCPQCNCQRTTRVQSGR